MHIKDQSRRDFDEAYIYPIFSPLAKALSSLVARLVILSTLFLASWIVTGMLLLGWKVRESSKGLDSFHPP